LYLHTDVCTDMCCGPLPLKVEGDSLTLVKIVFFAEKQQRK
jgi:hypothetical protein